MKFNYTESKELITYNSIEKETPSFWIITKKEKLYYELFVAYIDEDNIITFSSNSDKVINTNSQYFFENYKKDFINEKQITKEEFLSALNLIIESIKINLEIKHKTLLDIIINSNKINKDIYERPLINIKRDLLNESKITNEKNKDIIDFNNIQEDSFMIEGLSDNDIKNTHKEL